MSKNKDKYLPSERHKQTLRTKKAHGCEGHSSHVGHAYEAHVVVSHGFWIPIRHESVGNIHCGLRLELLEGHLVMVSTELADLAGLMININNIWFVILDISKVFYDYLVWIRGGSIMSLLCHILK